MPIIKKYIFIPSWYPVFGVKAGNFFVDLFTFYKKALPESYLVYIFLEKRKTNRLIKLLISNNILFKKIYFRYTYTKRVEHNRINNEGQILIKITTCFDSDRVSGNQFLYLQQLVFAYSKTVNKYFKGNLHILAQAMEFAGLVAYRISKNNSKIQYSITEHNYFSSGRFDDNLLPTVRSAYSNAGLLFYCSHSKMQQVLATGLNSNVRNFVNYNYITNHKELIKPYNAGDDLRIIIVAAASHFKDINIALSSLIMLKKHRIKFNVRLVGISSWGSREKYIDEGLLNFLRDEIEIIPHLENIDLIKLYLDSNIFLLTSLAEGMPVSLLEALSLGLIPIVTRHGGSEEIVIGGLHGFVLNIRDVEGILNSFKKIYLGNFKHVPELNSRRARNFSDYESFYKNTVGKLFL